jgi:hypothetical protein
LPHLNWVLLIISDILLGYLLVNYNQMHLASLLSLYVALED